MEAIAMKTYKIVLEVLITLAALAGIVFVVVKYGDKIIAWVKKQLNKIGCELDCFCEDDFENPELEMANFED